MNIYIRYFDKEALAQNVDEALQFLTVTSRIKLDETLLSEVRTYAESNVMYPKRFKINQHLYFIMIKTTVETLEEFKEKSAGATKFSSTPDWDKDALQRALNQKKPGWYRAVLSFKRVVPTQENAGKFQYLDTEFEARLKAHSVQDCYERVMDHLHARGDIDPRSQFPSIKGRNFRAEYLGMPRGQE